MNARMRSDPYFILYIKINVKWIKDWNIKPEIVKLLEEKIGMGGIELWLQVHYLCNDFLHRAPKIQTTVAPKRHTTRWSIKISLCLSHSGHPEVNFIILAEQCPTRHCGSPSPSTIIRTQNESGTITGKAVEKTLQIRV